MRRLDEQKADKNNDDIDLSGENDSRIRSEVLPAQIRSELLPKKSEGDDPGQTGTVVNDRIRRNTTS